MLLPFLKAGIPALIAALALLALAVACATAEQPTPVPTNIPIPTATPSLPSWVFSERRDDVTDTSTVTIELRAYKSPPGPVPTLQVVCNNEEGWKVIAIDWGVSIASLSSSQPLPVSWQVDGEITPSQSWRLGIAEGRQTQTYRVFRPLSAVDGFGAMPGRHIDEYIQDLRRAEKIVATVYPKDGDSIKAVWYTTEFAEAYKPIAEECNLTIP